MDDGLSELTLSNHLSLSRARRRPPAEQRTRQVVRLDAERVVSGLPLSWGSLCSHFQISVPSGKGLQP